MNVGLLSITKPTLQFNNNVGLSSEDFIVYIARVSNKKNQLNFDTSEKLLKYLIDNNHWSPFEHVFMTLEINTSRAIASQILRHRSFSFQEFSQRYQKISSYEEYSARRQDIVNRQNSIDDINDEDKNWFIESQKNIWDISYNLYNKAIDKGISKESARFLLPLNTSTKIYMSGSIRSWIHYIQVRTDVSTQKEHRDIAEECKKIFKENFKNISIALNF